MEAYTKHFKKMLPGDNFTCSQITETPPLWKAVLTIPNKKDSTVMMTFEGQGKTKMDAQNEACKTALENW